MIKELPNVKAMGQGATPYDAWDNFQDNLEGQQALDLTTYVPELRLELARLLVDEEQIRLKALWDWQLANEKATETVDYPKVEDMSGVPLDRLEAKIRKAIPGCTHISMQMSALIHNIRKNYEAKKGVNNIASAISDGIVVDWDNRYKISLLRMSL